MAFTYPRIIELAKRSGIQYKVTSTFRPGAITKSGNVSHHARGDAVDFGGYSQDALAEYYMGLDTLEVFHKSRATGKWYGKSRGKLVDEATHQTLVKDHENHLHVAMSAGQVASVGKPGGLLDLLPSGIPNPFSAAASMVDLIRPFGVAGTNLINPNFWRRIGMGVIGGGLIVVGLLYVNRRPIGQAVSTVTGAVGSVAGTAIQGAAFGAGAGATGGLGSSRQVSSVPVTGPRPPRRALPSNAPVTSPLPPEIYAPVSGGGTYTVTAVGRAKRPAAKLPDSSGLGGKPHRKKSSKSAFKPSVSNPLKSGPYSDAGS